MSDLYDRENREIFWHGEPDLSKYNESLLQKWHKHAEKNEQAELRELTRDFMNDGR